MIQQVALIFSYMLINIHENMGNNSNQRKRGISLRVRGTWMELEEGDLGKTEGRKREGTRIKLYLN